MRLYESEDHIISSFKTKKRLNSRIWRGTELKPPVRRTLMQIADDFIEFLGIDVPVSDVIFTGSMANYDWSQFSDIDIHIITDFKKINADQDIVEELFKTKKTVWNDMHDISVYGYPVELYVEDVNAELHATGIYSLKTDKWIEEPSPENKTAPAEVKKKAERIMQIIDEIELASRHPSQNLLSKVETMKDKIKQMRTSGLSSGGEYSVENLAFKYIRRNGYLEKLMNIKTEVYDRLRSI